MRKQILILKLFTLVILVAIASCKKEETYPVTPVISFKSLVKFQNVFSNDSLELTFSFTDGDGDIGTAEGDSVNRDVFVKLFEKKNGVFVEFVNLNAPLEYNIPYLVPRGNNSSLVGDIKINIDYNILQPNDTIKYELYIKDRARHSSNSITTSEIITNIQ
ncbi:MAG TPA: hypothetical protein PKD91_11080 [Bacteroidia bacterium]|nr:hypothetical protein [Bacteroidia bacterium]